MSNKDNYDRVFIESFDLDEKKLNDKLEYNSIKSWDSIGHMQMIAELEDAFEIEFEMDDIIAMESIAKIREILLSLNANLDDI